MTVSTDLPGTSSGAQPIYGGGGLDAYVARFDATLADALDPATYLGGTEDDEVITLRFHPTSGEVYVGGYTISTDFPRTTGGAQAISGESPDAFAARLTPNLSGVLVPAALVVDPAPTAASDGNGVFEPGETVSVEPAWSNLGSAPAPLTGAASAFAGPPGATYTVLDAAAGYGSVPVSGTRSCSSTSNCFRMSVTAPATRPILHWDATFLETPSTTDPAKTWKLHIGDSFTDVSRTNIYYRFIETIFHHGVTGGCGTAIYCPSNTVTRAQMAVFLLRSMHGPTFTPPPATGIFGDVPAGGGFAPWIEQLFAEGITAGCGGGNYCPNSPLTRAQMSVFLLVAKHGSGYVPPPATGTVFSDVSAGSFAAAFIERLVAEGISAGCGCPSASWCSAHGAGRSSSTAPPGRFWPTAMA